MKRKLQVAGGMLHVKVLIDTAGTGLVDSEVTFVRDTIADELMRIVASTPYNDTPLCKVVVR